MELQLTEMIPSADVLLALAPEELAGILLEYFQRRGNPDTFEEHPGNFPSSGIMKVMRKKN